jgi:hypothetical protein
MELSFKNAGQIIAKLVLTKLYARQWLLILHSQWINQNGHGYLASLVELNPSPVPNMIYTKFIFALGTLTALNNKLL